MRGKKKETRLIVRITRQDRESLRRFSEKMGTSMSEITRRTMQHEIAKYCEE